MTLFGRHLFARPTTPSQAAAVIGSLGGRARAEQERERFKAKAREIREGLDLEPDPRLA